MVSDSGGPRPGHSVFTGHLLDALDGAAASVDGIITANSVMAYVYDRVAKDQHSRQTPHYGFLDGDGDFIFSEIPTDHHEDQAKKKEESNIIISVSPTLAEQSDNSPSKGPTDIVKEYLSEARHRIKLDDLFEKEVRRVISQLGTDAFPNSTSHYMGTDAIKKEFAERIKKYEDIVKQLQGMMALLGKWAGPEHRNILERVFARIAELNTDHNGLTVWIGLRWYPISLLMYSGGIAALAAGNYDNLAPVLTAKVGVEYRAQNVQEVIIPTVSGMLEVTRSELFKTLPGHGNNYTPESEYLFKALQPALEDVLFLGRSYEFLFDRFEILRALVYADIVERSSSNQVSDRVWGPIGRFGWKYNSHRSGPDDPYSQLVLEASRSQDSWPPLRAGLFNGSYERFNDLATRFGGLLSNLGWF